MSSLLMVVPSWVLKLATFGNMYVRKWRLLLVLNVITPIIKENNKIEVKKNIKKISAYSLNGSGK